MVSFDALDALGDNAAYRAALAAEGEGRLREAHRLLRSVHGADERASVRARIEKDIRRVVVAMFGVKGSDQTMSVWSDAPLQTKTQPPLILFYGTCQIGRRVYRFGGPCEETERSKLA
ncbi:hypothetical protein THAOC_16349 [Thalassiosira oceanica]|uniref:Uncharacterized protein n=1 Tax=Thalassiosira oceanica TaxID=159749 RepID=K0SXN0_THAOC|nr:hypothetical protein THAOC_16349 [Thalassiosira oceanica]|eukprot:EJK63017.1 hypothetical protein THAOC_16349 [Thalassiosira oceanica]